jgi:hypothetical protein
VTGAQDATRSWVWSPWAHAKTVLLARPPPTRHAAESVTRANISSITRLPASPRFTNDRTHVHLSQVQADIPNAPDRGEY